jgi:Squalene-hopene cyclase C-terminal domain/Prenyltransferase and squalene oxidase repeat
MVIRRLFLHKAMAGVLGLGIARRTLLADQRDNVPDGSTAKDMITSAAQQAIDQGLAFLAKHQHADGSFGAIQYEGNVAVTSLAALALMAGGHQPGRGIYGESVTRALRYVLDQDDGRGYLLSRIGTSHGPMYGHGFGTLFLAEVYGMVHDNDLKNRLRETLKRAVKLIVDGQNPEGGWRYQPGSRDADISVTICQIMALRAARNAGFFVSKKTVDRCVAYVRRCQNSDGGFRYQANGQTSSEFARSAAGVVGLYCAGIYKGPDVQAALNYLMGYKPREGFVPHDVFQHYYYGHYYAAQAMWTAGGRYWSEWFPAIREELLSHAERNRQSGCWQDHRFSNDYGTAMACIILQIPNNYLPILQK